MIGFPAFDKWGPGSATTLGSTQLLPKLNSTEMLVWEVDRVVCTAFTGSPGLPEMVAVQITLS
jgi:hypothetical protein